VPVSYSVDHRRQRIHAVASGAVNVADFAAYIAARVKDGVYDYDQLLDFSGATLDVASQDVLNMVRQARHHLAKKPIPFTAIVAKQGTATYGLARQLCTLFDFEGASVHIADSVEAATVWLDEMRSGTHGGVRNGRT
jgi:hypothetical protein